MYRCGCNYTNGPREIGGRELPTADPSRSLGRRSENTSPKSHDVRLMRLCLRTQLFADRREQRHAPCSKMK